MNAAESSSQQSWFVSNRHFAIEFLRIFLGGLLFTKGYIFIENINEIYGLIEENMEYSSFVIAHYVAIAHLVGGLMLLFGLYTRLASIIQLPVLIGAVFFIDTQDTMLATGSQFEYSILVMVLLLVFTVYGGGKWSADHRIIRKKKKK
ncbi:DoxX family protein [Rhodohalobacter sp. 8-1]|uniref:DoxX family protein n=1 Tax=Rhodohalobacter sp. 8-1 TaxID=3131972 RepID=UPI0030EE9DCA